MEIDNKQEHPSYGMLSFHRVRGGNPYLFGSVVKHNEKIELQIKKASCERKLSKDWYHGRETLVSVEMSYSQFAEAIASMNTEGVPCTITYTQQEGRIPDCEFESVGETYRHEFEKTINGASEDTASLIKELQDVIFSKKTLSKADKEKIITTLTQIKYGIDENAKYVSSQFDRHMEDVVKEAKGEVEAFTQAKLNSIALAALAEKERLAELEQFENKSKEELL